jgi:hypothetical protein
MAHHAERPDLAIRRLVNGYQMTQAISVAATLGLADLLVEGPRTSDELARHTGGNFRLVQRLFSQIERILRINELQTITQEVVEAAREPLVVGALP